jgi:hypothetical protein
MSKENKLTLIEGNFNMEEAEEILMGIFNSKIKFHQHKNFSTNERYGKYCKISVTRIPELKQSIEEVKEILLKAKNVNTEIHISSIVNIKLIDKK